MVADLGDPTLLAAALARAVGAMVLLEGGEEPPPPQLGLLGEMAAASTGLGVLLLTGACVYKKGCGGLKAYDGTLLSVEEHAVLLALFCRVHDHAPGLARRHLAVTQVEAFDEALRWADSNDALVRHLRQSPEMLVDGVFPIQPTKGFFGRLFGRRAARKGEETMLGAPPARPARARTEAEMRRLEEARALVEDAFRES